MSNENQEVKLDDWDDLAFKAQQFESKLSVNESGPVEDGEKADSLELSSAELLTDAVSITAEIFAPNWHITPEEAGQLGGVYGKLLDKYAPETDFSKWMPEIGAVMVTGMIIKSRIGVPLKLEPPKSDDETQGQEKEPEQQQVIHGNSTGQLTAKAVK